MKLALNGHTLVNRFGLEKAIDIYRDLQNAHTPFWG